MHVLGTTIFHTFIALGAKHLGGSACCWIKIRLHEQAIKLLPIGYEFTINFHASV